MGLSDEPQDIEPTTTIFTSSSLSSMSIKCTDESTISCRHILMKFVFNFGVNPQPLRCEPSIPKIGQKDTWHLITETQLCPSLIATMDQPQLTQDV